MKILYIICVLYNKKISEIRSLQQFLSLNSSEVELIVCDNSNSDICEQNEREYNQMYSEFFTYIPNYENLGLGKAYNKCIVSINPNDAYIMFADDDTYFSSEYLDNVLNSVLNRESLIISGIIETDTGQFFSPLHAFRLFKKEKNIITKLGTYENIVCINAGFTFHSSLYKTIGQFPESIFLDMLDYWTAYKLSECKVNKVQIVGGTISQNFSGEVDDISTIERRFKIYGKDYREFCRLTKKNIIVRTVGIYKRKIKIMLMKAKKILLGRLH